MSRIGRFVMNLICWFVFVWCDCSEKVAHWEWYLGPVWRMKKRSLFTKWMIFFFNREENFENTCIFNLQLRFFNIKITLFRRFKYCASFVTCETNVMRKSQRERSVKRVKGILWSKLLTISKQIAYLFALRSFWLMYKPVSDRILMSGRFFLRSFNLSIRILTRNYPFGNA